MGVEDAQLSPKLSVPILYLWFGSTVPEDYLISLSQLSYPYIFLKNPSIERKFSRPLLDVEKADYYRLEYLYHNGGIYSDFDNTIDYPCLMGLLSKYRESSTLVLMTDHKHTREKTKETTTNLIFAPQKKLPILSQMLNDIDENSGKEIWEFAGIGFVGKYSEPLEVDMSECVIHSYDWSWYRDSNEVLQKSQNPHLSFEKKNQKKKEITEERNLIQNKLNEEMKVTGKLKASVHDLNEENSRLSAELERITRKYQTIEKRTATKDIKEGQILSGLNSAGNEQLILLKIEAEKAKVQCENLRYEKDLLNNTLDFFMAIVFFMLIAVAIFSICRKKVRYAKVPKQEVAF